MSTTVFIRLKRDEPMSARLFPNAEKVEFEKGDVRIAEIGKAKSLSTSYSRFFEIVNADQLTDEEIADARKFHEKNREEKEKSEKEIAKEQEKAAKQLAKEKEKAEKEQKKKEKDVEKKKKEREVELDELDKELEGLDDLTDIEDGQ